MSPEMLLADASGSASSVFRQMEGVLAAAQLVLAMLGMGATLRPDDFRQIASHWRAILLVLVAQFVVGPAIATAAAWWLPIPAGIALGLLLLSVMPSGAMSNIFTHLGHGNLPLSITATVASTTACLVLTPAVLGLLGESTLASTVRMPTDQIIRDVLLFLLLPVAAGMLVRYRAPEAALPFARWMVRASLVVLAIIAIGSLGSGRIDVWSYGWLVPVLLIAFVLAQFFATRLLTILMRYNAADGYTLAIEVALRNGNLAILISATMFPTISAVDTELSAGALYVALFYGGASLVLAIIAVALERHRIRGLAPS